MKTKMTAADFVFATVCALGVSGSVFVENGQVALALGSGACFWIVEVMIMIVAYSI